MTRRERMENRVERREEWAQKRQARASATLAHTSRFTGDHAFNTQPGHIPARARIIAAEDRAYTDMNMAKHHTEKAAGIQEQLNRSIFSDDPDATEQLDARIAKLEAKRAGIKAVNSIIRKAPKNVRTPEKDAALLALGASEGKIAELFTPDFCGRIGFPEYVLTNLGGNIRRLKERLVTIAAQEKRQEAAEAAGGVSITGSAEYVNVTFSEKPDRAILDDLRAAGFAWGGGHWSGYRSKIPQSVLAMQAEETLIRT